MGIRSLLATVVEVGAGPVRAVDLETFLVVSTFARQSDTQ